jgi:hypothetical protein
MANCGPTCNNVRQVMLVDGKQIAVAMAFVRPVSISRSEAVQSIQSDGKVIAKDGLLVKLGKPPTGCINAEAPFERQATVKVTDAGRPVALAALPAGPAFQRPLKFPVGAVAIFPRTFTNV